METSQRFTLSALRAGRAGAGPRGSRAGRRLPGQAHRIHRALHRGRHHRSGGAPRARRSRRNWPAVIVENRPGAGGNIGMDAVAKAAPDGYTIGFGAISTNALNPFVYPSMPFDPTKDFTGISMLGASSVVLETGPRSRSTASRIWSPMPSSIRAPRSARRNGHVDASGGRDVRPADRRRHAAHSLQGQRAGINDLLGGHLPIMFDNLPASLPHIKSGKVRALAVTGSKRAGAAGRAHAG